MQPLKILLCALLVCQMTLGLLANTADPAANVKTKKIYAAMCNLKGKLVSGAYGGWTGTTDPIKFGLDEANGIQRATHKSPLVYGLDCSPAWFTKDPGHEQDLVECFHKDFAEYGKRGGILAISHLLPSPFFAGNQVRPWVSAVNITVSNREYATVFQNGSPARKRWLAILNKVAQGLKVYQNMGITVLYRPFREQNGEWFWWGAIKEDLGNRERMELFKKLHIDVFNFMKGRGLNNLLWVYAPDNGRDFKSGFYPGPQYVDFACLDWYTDDYNALNGYDEMVRLGKPMCLAEVGPRNNYGNFDYGQLVNSLLTKYPKTAFYMSWNREHSPLTNKGVVPAYNNPRVVNLGDLRY